MIETKKVCVYVAARYARRMEAAVTAQHLRNAGFLITSTWHDGAKEWSGDPTEQDLLRCAVKDMQEISDADCVLTLTDIAGEAYQYGSHHVEFGLGYAWGKTCILIGQKELMFHRLPGVWQFDTLAGFLESKNWFGKKEKTALANEANKPKTWTGEDELKAWGLCAPSDPVSEYATDIRLSSLSEEEKADMLKDFPEHHLYRAPCDGQIGTDWKFYPDGKHQLTSARKSLPTSSQERKNTPMCTGVLDYFPLALAGVARISKKGNDKHNPGEPLHWSREKSADHADCIMRHLVDRGKIDKDGERHSGKVAWRSLALYQIELEEAAKK